MDGRRKRSVSRRRAGLVWLVALLAACSAAGGCGEPTASTPPGEMDPEQYGKLPGLSSIPLPKLRDELARIVEEGGTPELLSGDSVPDAENVAVVLKDLFDPEKVESILAEANKIYPPPKLGFAFDPIRLQRAVAFRKSRDAERQRARVASRRPRCDFGIRHEAGQFADLSAVDVVWILSRLEAFQAAEQLHADELDAAIESFGHMLRLAQCLAAEKHVVPRGQAAFMRSEALLVLNAIVRHPNVTREQLEKLASLVNAQLADWPEDAGVWIGDRAMGMHCYELVRDGKLLMLLCPADIELLGGKEVLGQLPEAARRTVNEDESYYLETMRRIIESCRQPYFQRAELFEAIRGDLQARKGTAEFPLVAGHLLLPGLESAHVIQARDRAICEAWAMALALAAGKERPPYKISPRTGAPYEVVRKDGRVEVSGIGVGPGGDNPRLTVPDLSGKTSGQK